jgi:hypothetical protein
MQDFFEIITNNFGGVRHGIEPMKQAGSHSDEIPDAA